MPTYSTKVRPKVHQAAHLPPDLADADAYDRLYREVNPWGHYAVHNGPWKEIRIPPACPAAEVYQRLPSALDYEYGGYLTRTRIFYRKCGRDWAGIPNWKACTFHSHPTAVGRGEPDVPSSTDIRGFLLGPQRRSITVGRFILWVWDKTEKTLPLVRRFAAWERDHLCQVVRRIERRNANWEEAYATEALRQLGLEIPSDPVRWSKVWPRQLRDRLGVTIKILDRENA